MALAHKMPGGESILVSIAAGEALVGHIEEGKVALLLHHIADLAPLFLGWVDTGRVVGASVEKDDAVLRGGLDVGNQTLEVETNGVLVVVTILFNLQARVLEDSVVVGPARVREVDLFRVGIEALQESTTDSQGTGTRNGLGDDEAVLLNGRGVLTIGQLCSGLGERRNTGDTSVLLVKAGGNNLVLCGANRGQNVGLTLVITC